MGTPVGRGHGRGGGKEEEESEEENNVWRDYYRIKDESNIYDQYF